MAPSPRGCARPRAALTRAAYAVAAACLAALLVAAPAVWAAEAPWPMGGHDAAHTGTAEGPEPPYRVAWSSGVPAEPVAGPVVVGDRVIVVGATTVAALDAETGDVLWEHERAEGPAGPAAATRDAIVHSSGSGSAAALVARSIDDGRELWRAFTGSEVPGGPVVVAGDVVYLGTRAGSVFAIDSASGETRWEFDAAGRADAAPAASEDLVVVVAEDRGAGTTTVHGLAAEDGREEWRYSPPAVALGSSSVSLAGEVAVVGMGDGRIRALALDDGAEVWSARALGGPQAFRPRQVPAVPGDVLVADALAVHHLDTASGEERWTYRLDDLLTYTSPSSVGPWTVFGDASGEAAAIDQTTGRLVWRADVGAGAIAAPAVDTRRVYLSVVGDDGAVVALEHDPAGRLRVVPAATALFPRTALLNFAAAFAMVGAATYLLFRYVVRDRPEPEGGGADPAEAST